ncbi:hypothetical protein HU200_023802 [Digitaria exilis]|uniref:Uncharacterized protein n=1 Tax=Digitaria exilis TaxID=1010633 RepID=A0A835EU62_9POAL|nr:hypothetical protein HU200_023802 [Digitaria exilis]
MRPLVGDVEERGQPASKHGLQDMHSRAGHFGLGEEGGKVQHDEETAEKGPGSALLGPSSLGRTLLPNPNAQETKSTQGRKTLAGAAMPPPQPGLDAGYGVARSSRSAIVVGTATGYHLLNIEWFTHTKELPTGHRIRSRPFTLTAGGSSWRIYYYPNGDQSDAAEFISVYLELDLDQGVAESVEAQAKFSLLDQTGVPVRSHSEMTQMRKWSKGDGGFGYRKFINRAWLEESGHLKDDCFTIRFDVFVPKELRTEDRAVGPVLVDVPPFDLHLHLERLLAARTGADVTFEVAGETIRAHRFFETELFGPMKESADTTVIRVDDMEAEVFRALLGFIYTDTLQDCPAVEEAAMAQHLLVAADRYNLDRLKLICEDNLCMHIDTGSVVTILALAEQHHCHGLKQACFHFLSSPLNLNAVMATDGFEHLTRSCPSVLKELMSNIAARVPLGY